MSSEIPMDSLDELDDTSDFGSEYELPQSATKKRKAKSAAQPPKRPARAAAGPVTRSQSSSSSPHPGEPGVLLQEQRTPRGRSRQAPPTPARGANGDRDITAKELFDAVCSGKTAMQTVVDEWLDDYKLDREAGLLVLINFIVQCCGCKGVVSREMFDHMENAEIIGNLTKDFNENSVNYPLSTPGPQLKRFKSGICEFARVLVRFCRNSILYDEYVFPSLLALLTGLSDSQVRAFRHTSTLLALKLMTGLVDVLISLLVQLQTTQRQLDVEESKNLLTRAPDRVEELQATIKQLGENKVEVSSLLKATFRGVFVHRYRDRLPEIRAACIEELGVWMKTHPEEFLNDGCLKYLGWTLSDKQSPVRLRCVRALQGLYEEKEFIGRLELFTSRFKERMLCMVLDKEPDVAVEVVNLLLLIQQITEDGLSVEECAHIYPLVYAAHRGLASAGGAFLYNKLRSVISSNYREHEKRDHVAFFQILVSFYLQNEFHEHGAYLVDSLWTVAASELKDWDTMTGLLLQDANEGLTYEEEGVLLDIMMCAVKQAALGTPPVGRGQGKKTLSMKDRKTQEQDRSRLTTHFIPILPLLVGKYSADPKKVSLLLKAPLYFDLEMYSSTQRLEKHLNLLISQICALVEKNTDPGVLRACAELANALCAQRFTFSGRAHLAFSQLLDELTDCFNSSLNELLKGEADEEDMYTATTALKKIAILSSIMDPTGLKLFDSCIELLKSRIETLDTDTELMAAALRCAAFHLMWAKVKMNNSKPTEAELGRLRAEVRSCCRVCQAFLSVDQTEIRDQAFALLCDLLLVYGERSIHPEPHLQSLVHLPSDSLRSELASFLLDYVFNDEDQQCHEERDEELAMTLLQKRRNQLAGYCKLVLYGVLDLSAATNVFKHYSKHFKDFGDIIKETVSKSKLISPVQSAKTVCLCLQQLFSEMLTDDPTQHDITEIRDLAKRLAMSFGIDLHRIRKPLVTLHLDGIRFASRTAEENGEQFPNTSFLEILSEFSFKLLPQDRIVILEFLKTECPPAALSRSAVKFYRCSLESRSFARSREHDMSGASLPPHDVPAAKRRRTVPGSASSSTTHPWPDSSSIHSRLHTPVLTSTVLKQPLQKPATRTTQARGAAASDAGSGITELESEDEFSSQMPDPNPVRHGHPSSTRRERAADQEDVESQMTLMSLIESDASEGEENIHSGEEEDEGELEIDDYESDSESSYTLPSTRHTSASVLDELFD